MILAGGKSTRFGEKNKLDLTLNGEDLIGIALRKYCSRFAHVVLSSRTTNRLHTEDQAVVLPSADSKGLSILYALEYFESIGLKSIILAEAARPFTDEGHIDALVDLLQTGSNAVISGFPTWESVYHVPKDVIQVLPREELHIGQTPEGWNIAALKYAVQTNMGQSTDVSYSFGAVLGASDFTVDYCEGTRENIKITYDVDEVIAKALAEAWPALLTWGE